MRLLTNGYRLYDLNDNQQDELYKTFYDTYMKETGGAFDRDTFDSTASKWVFFGVKPETDGRQCGGICAREMRSGSLKLTGSFGNLRGIMDGLKEMETEYGDRPIIGFMPKKLIGMLCRADPNFIEPPSIVVKTIVPILAKSGTLRGIGQIYPDGSADFNTPSGVMRKWAVCNKVEIRWLLESGRNQKIPVPNVVIKLLEKILGV